MIDLTTYGFNPWWQAQMGDTPFKPARVLAVHRGLFDLVSQEGFGKGRLSGRFVRQQAGLGHPATGDFVLTSPNPGGEALIEGILPRISLFSRPDMRGHAVGYAKSIVEQVVAANFDTVCILASLNFDFNLRRLERYLAVARQSGGTPVVVLTKADLVQSPQAQVADARCVCGNTPVFPLSAHTGEGVEQLAPYLQPGKTLVFLGSSGVGKSSLVNALAGEDLMAVKTIRADDSKGRHTTTRRQMLILPSGVMIIDTPGMRELGLWAAGAGLADIFTDIHSLTAQCRFGNCHHETEPGCAVKAALAEGTLDIRRWHSFLALNQEAAFTQRRAAQLERKWDASKARKAKASD